jgi:hypothetical protein
VPRSPSFDWPRSTDTRRIRPPPSSSGRSDPLATRPERRPELAGQRPGVRPVVLRYAGALPRRTGRRRSGGRRKRRPPRFAGGNVAPGYTIPSQSGSATNTPSTRPVWT